MARKQDSANKDALKAEVARILAEDRDVLKSIVSEALQQTLEAEMDEALGAEKSERTPNRVGYRSGYYGRTLITRVGKIELRVPQDRQGRFRPIPDRHVQNVNAIGERAGGSAGSKDETARLRAR